MRFARLACLAAALAGFTAALASDSVPQPADGAWRWSEGVYRWHYSRAAQPSWFDPGVGVHLFRSAAEEWAPCGVRIEFAGETDLPPGRMDGINVAGWSAALPPAMRGTTFKRRAGDALIEADIAINAANHPLRASPELLRKVILHEFGHALGLVHSPDCGDVMSFGAACRLPARELPQRPKTGDLAQCAARYGAVRIAK